MDLPAQESVSFSEFLPNSMKRSAKKTNLGSSYSSMSIPMVNQSSATGKGFFKSKHTLT